MHYPQTTILKYMDFYLAKQDPASQMKLSKIKIKSEYKAPELEDDEFIYNKPVDIWFLNSFYYKIFLKNFQFNSLFLFSLC